MANQTVITILINLAFQLSMLHGVITQEASKHLETVFKNLFSVVTTHRLNVCDIFGPALGLA